MATIPPWEREQSNNGALLNTPVRRHRRRRILQNVDAANAVDAAWQANYDAGADDESLGHAMDAPSIEARPFLSSPAGSAAEETCGREGARQSG
jgi:hypothetical protein